jgi:NAD(P) transhydrogenase subunit alpha
MLITVLREDPSVEPRVAATPETVRKFIAAGANVLVESQAGAAAGFSDAQYTQAGATLAVDGEDAARDADLILAVRRPERVHQYKRGAAVIALMDPYGAEEALRRFGEAGVSTFALELIPRITRAQVMDVLSSQANLAGYQAVIEAAAAFGRAMPMMMTAAGTVPAARVFVMGAGVAGLQAIATARRLGAVVTATDVRPAAKEQVASLGAKFVAVEDEEFKAAETSGGYAREMSAEYRMKQAALVRDHIAKQNVVITTALIPGRPAPKLVSQEMVMSMPDGSVIVDLAAERGGNVEGGTPGQVSRIGGVTVISDLNMAGRIAASSSALLARNIYAFVEPMIDKANGALRIDRGDEVVAATLLTTDGGVVHPAFAPAAAAGQGGPG